MATSLFNRLDANSAAAARGLSDLQFATCSSFRPLLFPDHLQRLSRCYTPWATRSRISGLDQRSGQFVGLQNYRELLSDPFIWTNFTITAKYVIISVTGQVLVGFGLALLLNRDIPFKGLRDDVAAIADDAVDGRGRPVLETALRSVLRHHQLFPWPGKIRVARRSRRGALCRCLTDIWMWSPFVMLLSLAGLSAVPKHLYEAAEIDRASSFYTFFRITLPLVAPILMIAIIFRTMEAFKTFDLAYILSSQPTTELIAIRLYKMAFLEWQTGKSSRLRLYRADHGGGDHQYLCEVSQQGEGALNVRCPHSSEVWLNRTGNRCGPDGAGYHACADLLDHSDSLQAAQPCDDNSANCRFSSRQLRHL